MDLWNRVGTGLLGVAGLFLTGLMVYTLFFAGWRSDSEPGGQDRGEEVVAARVAIFLPDRHDWSDFRKAVAACRSKQILRLISDGEEALVVESPRSGRRVRFDRHDVRGVSDTRDEVRRLADAKPSPIAVVGSTTTVLTVAIAEPLREEGDSGPVLLIPWATALMVQRSNDLQGEARRDLVPLMELDPGRTFRFCPNNRRLADSVVDCLIHQDEGRLPARVFLVVDPFDPYSDDLADCFRRAIRGRKPDVEIVERADVVDLPGFARPLDASPEPSPTEVGLAAAIVSSGDADADRTTWVMLPLQDQPARRMIAALRRRASWRSSPVASAATAGSLRIVCGDAIERQAINKLAGLGGLSLWCASTSSSQPSDQGVSDDTQSLAEIASALVWAVDQASSPTPGPTEIRNALRRIDLAADSPSAFGRGLAFEGNGERRDDPERVLAIRADATQPVEFARTPGGSWEPTPPPSPPKPR